MLGIVNYIKHDLDGIYTAELVRGTLSMLLAVVIYIFYGDNSTSAYILIIALYGLRTLIGKTILRRIFNIIISLILLISTLNISLYFGQQHLLIPQIIFCIFLSSATVWSLERKIEISGTIMFMSVFCIVNFGMGTIDQNHDITQISMLKDSLLGALCVILAVLVVPFHSFHWCYIINYSFYTELKRYCKIMSTIEYNNNFTDLSCANKNKLLQIQSSLMHITSYIRDPNRQKLYQEILNSLMLISYWPTYGTDQKHQQLIYDIRKQAFHHVYSIIKIKHHNLYKIQNSPEMTKANDFINQLQNTPIGEFCNGEMIQHTATMIHSLISLLEKEAKE